MAEAAQGPHPSLLNDLVTMPMPFGKYKGTVICYLPISYLEWFQREGFPTGKLGMLLSTMHEIQLNGLTHLLDPIKRGLKKTENPLKMNDAPTSI